MRYTNTNNGFRVHKLVIMTKQLGDSGVERIDCLKSIPFYPHAYKMHIMDQICHYNWRCHI